MKSYCEHFTPRQIKIARMVYEEDLSNEEIGNRLNCAASTIDNDIVEMSSIFRVKRKGRYWLAIQLKKSGCF